MTTVVRTEAMTDNLQGVTNCCQDRGDDRESSWSDHCCQDRGDDRESSGSDQLLSGQRR